jgi:hypothetical protein
MTRLRIILTSLALALSLFAPAAARPIVAADETNLTAAVFAFDFSGSIYCYKSGKDDTACKNPINASLANAVDQLATDIENGQQQFVKRAIDFKVVQFGSDGKSNVVRISGDRCTGNTADEVLLLVSCLREVASQYRDPRNELGGTSFSQVFDDLETYSSEDRCGLILFTDGQPDDKTAAERLSDQSNCSVLPVATGTEKNVDVPWLKDFTKTDMTQIEGCDNQTDFTWNEVFFETADAAASAIGDALSEVACLKRVPGWPRCDTVDAIKAALEATGLTVNLAAGVVGSEYPVGVPLPGTYVARDGGVTISSSTPTPPEGCEAPPTPTPEPTPTPTPTTPIPPREPCRADFPSLPWFGCNPWALLLLLLLIGARLWWVRRDLQVSINGQEAIALYGGTRVGFDLYQGNAERTPNPDGAQVKITRAWWRAFPGTRLDTSVLTGATDLKPVKLEIGKEVDLTSGVSAVLKYGNPQPYTGDEVSGSSNSTVDSGSPQGGGSSTAW